MADQWYFEWQNKTFGPYSAAQLKKLAFLGRLQPTDAVWKEDRRKAVRANRIKNLYPNLAAEPTPTANAAVPEVVDHS